MGVIEYERTGLADRGRDWDGDAERARAEISDLRVMCAWVRDPGLSKDDFKLPHHTAEGHLCVLAGVRSALHLLAAANVPDSDRGGVEAHLRRHLRDFGIHDAQQVGDVAPLRVTMQGDVASRAGSRRYAVAAISAGVGNGLSYAGAVLEAAVPLFESVPVFVDHAQLGERMSQTGGRSVRNVLGVLEHVFYSEQSADSPSKNEGRGTQ
jgi:hypothetical protein